jgi:hypothetical protein
MTTTQKMEIKKAVSAALREIFSDPDYGLGLTAAFKRKLEASERDIRTGRTLDLREYLRTKK